jgi:hypothetical protein
VEETPEIKATSEYAPNDEGRQERWNLEIAAAKKNLQDFWRDGRKVLGEYKGKSDGKKRLNLWYADVQTKSSTLSGEPKVRARRRYADAKDDVARVSAEMVERLLNADVERDSDGYRRALSLAKGDWLKVALGQIRLRYVVEENADGTKAFEDVETDYVHWDDFLWSPCKVWGEVRWVAYATDMGRDALHERFDATLGEVLVERIPLNGKAEKEDEKAKDTLARARVWEVWDKERKEVCWIVEGFAKPLDVQSDPLGLPNFFPSPEPLAANLTSDEFVPRSSFFLAEDLYAEAHELTRRIRALVKTIKVVGAYAKGNEALERVLSDACENQLVPVANLASLMGEDGLSKAAWIMPIEPQVRALVELVQQRNLVRSDIAEVLGLSDIMRGQQAQRVTATTDRIKARAFSMRTQTDQDEYARFASDAQRIRAFMVSNLFDAATIIKRSNIENAAAPEVIAQAVQLLKQDISVYRIEVDSDALSMTDFDAVRQERIEGLTALGGYLQQSVPFVQMVSAAGPTAAQAAVKLVAANGQWLIAGLPGATALEENFDRFIADFEQAIQQAMAQAAAQPPQPDPKVEAEKVKLETTKVQAQAKVQGAQVDMAKTQMDMQAKVAEHGMKMQQMQAGQQIEQADFGLRMAEMKAKHEAAKDMPKMEERG